MNPAVPSNAWLISLIEGNHKAAEDGHRRLGDTLTKLAQIQQEHRDDWQSDHDELTNIKQRVVQLDRERDSMSTLRLVLLTTSLSAGVQLAILVIGHIWKG